MSWVEKRYVILSEAKETIPRMAPFATLRMTSGAAHRDIEGEP